MTNETLKVYAPCPLHRFWHDVEKGCLLCMYEKAQQQSIDKLQPGAAIPVSPSNFFVIG